MGFLNGGWFLNTSHCKQHRLILHGSILALWPCDGMLDNEKRHWIGFTRKVILKWFQNQVEWKFHPTQLDFKKLGKNYWTCMKGKNLMH
jgi:hypothetical protein